MTKKQKLLILILTGALLLVLTFFREEWFTQSHAGLWIYRLLATGSLVLIAGAAGRLLGKKMMWAAIFALFLAEGGVAMLFQAVKNGKQLPEKITKALGYIYLFHCRDYIVYDEDRGQYDPELFYTLKPGDFEYSNMEFSTDYRVNHAGFRDDEASLALPEIIFLGDSYTMGWGVGQDESFASILEKKLGRNALNAGIASYGTARELLAFGRILHDSCKLLILQFCPNDVKENRLFVENGFSLDISPKAVFEKEVMWNKLYQVYFPLKYLHSAIYYFAQKIKSRPVSSGGVEASEKGELSPRELEDFFAILKKIKEEVDGNIVVFNLGMNITSPAVNEQFEAWLHEHPMDGVHVFPSTDYLTKGDYLTLDTHLTKSGNRKLAEGLAGFVRERGLLQGF